MAFYVLNMHVFVIGTYFQYILFTTKNSTNYYIAMALIGRSKVETLSKEFLFQYLTFLLCTQLSYWAGMLCRRLSKFITLRHGQTKDARYEMNRSQSWETALELHYNSSPSASCPFEARSHTLQSRSHVTEMNRMISKFLFTEWNRWQKTKNWSSFFSWK